MVGLKLRKRKEAQRLRQVYNRIMVGLKQSYERKHYSEDECL